MSPLRRRWEFMLKPDETPEAMLDDAKIAELLKPWTKPGQVELIRKAVYRFHGLVAKAWRNKSVLLAGDSAHQMPPFMGQGMCSGIRDADNLAWKLIAVLRGDASAAILDTYQKEREPHVRFIIEGAIGMGRVVCVQDPQAAAMRDQGMIAARAAQTALTPLPGLPALAAGFLHPSKRAGEILPQTAHAKLANGQRGKLDDLLTEGFVLLTKQAASALPPNVKQFILGSDITDETGRLDKWLDETGSSAALIRPDRYVFGTGNASDLVIALTAALRA
jgi:3-(3-hydroxy-phenyl)propionate hydroxylase